MKKIFIFYYCSFLLLNINAYSEDKALQQSPELSNELQVPTPPIPNQPQLPSQSSLGVQEPPLQSTEAPLDPAQPSQNTIEPAPKDNTSITPPIPNQPQLPSQSSLDVQEPPLQSTEVPLEPAQPSQNTAAQTQENNTSIAPPKNVNQAKSGLTIPSVASISKQKENDKPQDEDVKLKENNIADPVPKQYIEDKYINIGTGPNGGIYYPTGEAICRILNRNKKSVKLGCESEVTEGSVYNLKALSDGEISFALVQSDWQKRAYNGSNAFKKDTNAFENMRFLFSLHSELLTIIVKKGSNISSLNDIVKRSVNFGPEGSGTRALMAVVMNAKGWTQESFGAITSLSPNDQIYALCNKDIDVMIVVTGHPSDIVKEVSQACEIRVLNIASDPDIQNLVSRNPEYSIATIEAGIYQGVPQEINTFGTKATMVTTSDMSDDLVYRFTKAIFTNLDYLKKLYPTLSTLSADKMVKEGQTAPMHAGAAKYYREAGYIK